MANTASVDSIPMRTMSHAEFEGAKSAVRSVTSLDSRKEIVINLKIDRKKS